MPNPDWKRKLKVLLAVTLVLPVIYLIVYNRTFSFGNFVYLASVTQTIDELLHANTTRVSEEAMKLKSSTTNFTITSDKGTSRNHPIVADLYTLKGTVKGNDGHYKTERNKITSSIAHLTTASGAQLSRFTCREKQLDEIENIFHVPKVNCGKLLSGDLNEMVNSKKYVKSMNRTLLSEQFYLNLTTNCELFQSQRGYIMCPLTSEEENFPIAFSMMVYKDVEMVERLLRTIYRPQNYYCIHVDKKCDEQFMKAVSDITSCFDNVFLAPELVNVTWGEYSVLELELICMKHLWKYKKWKYFINLTGQEFPLKTNWELVQILKAYNGANDLLGTVNRTIRRRWRTQPPHNLTVVQGSVHIVVNRDFVDYILHNQTAKDLLDWVKHTIIPDETFFTMLNHNPQLGIRGSYKGIPESEPDASTVKPFLARFKNWRWSKHGYPCAGRYVRYICILTTGDLPTLGKSKHLFANKFFLWEDPIVIGCLEEMIFNNTRDEFKGDKQFNSTYYSQLGFVRNQVT
ncbi:Beta-1,3-galactosyl-O-glycosyl-glycoprotein beta-1,6-N-acetylglucosaminyltransferase [Bulinus truncatus]|nr:Beta-1,3-galactosyl-O-glycosyl-glycoprotein beta-1,6-N-acetylglucosaminyltransferase [Bulinus truncatus]